MKNAKLILLAIVSIALLNSCKGTSTEVNSVTTSSPVASSPSSQSNDKSKETIDPQILKEYQESQKKLVALLDNRVVKNTKQKVSQEIRDSLTKELTNFNAALEKIDKASNKDIQDKIKSFRRIIYFKNLSSETEDLKNLQQQLAVQSKDIGAEEGKFFGKKTSIALSEEIVKFGKDLQTLAKPTPTAATPAPGSPPPKQPPTSSADFNWLSALALLLSVLSLIGSFIAWNKTKNTTKKSKTNSPKPTQNSNKLSSDLSGDRASSDLGNDRSSDEVNQLKFDISTLRSDLEAMKSNYANLSNRFNNLSQPQINNAPDNYLEEIRPSSEHEGSLNHDQFASIRVSSSPQSAWIDDYNQDSRSFYTKYVDVEVSEEEDNIVGRRSGKVSSVNLVRVQKRTGGYWIFSQGNQNMLVPSDLPINQHSRDTVKAMFDYSEFRSGYRKIRLIEPAIVEANAAGGYQLIRRGNIEFE